MGGYEVGVDGDMGKEEVILVDDREGIWWGMKGKGVGEVGVWGVRGGMGKGVYKGRGIGVGDYGMSVDKVVDKVGDVV